MVALIQTTTKDDSWLWGAERIRGELLQPGIGVSTRTIQKYARSIAPLGRGGQTWRTFVRNHTSENWACGFLQICDVLFRELFFRHIVQCSS